jgi:hypothetical protein
MVVIACGGGARDRDAASSPAGQAPAGEAPATEASPSGERDGSAAVGRQALRDPVPMSATAEVDGQRYTFSGQGECQHTTDASIYQVPAALWSARFTDGGSFPYLNLTLWQPKGSSAFQVSLALTAGKETAEIATVEGGPKQGSATTARVTPTGGGGTFTIEGRDAHGHQTTLTVECSRFTEPVAEGG